MVNKIGSQQKVNKNETIVFTKTGNTNKRKKEALTKFEQNQLTKGLNGSIAYTTAPIKNTQQTQGGFMAYNGDNFC